jgi:hypothetical protein
MTISIPSRPYDVEAALQRWIQPDQGRGFLAWLGEGVQWESDEPAAVVGWVRGDEFQVRERQTSSRYAWRPVGRGRIVPTVAGTDLRITMRPWAPDLLGPATLIVLGAYHSGYVGSAMWLSATMVVAAVQSAVGWTLGVRRLQQALRTYFRLSASA